MKRTVAIKVIRPELINNEAAVKRFAKEAKAAARLLHPNIVTAHDAVIDGAFQFLVMEFVDGEGLNELVNRVGPLPAKEACGYIRQALRGLQHAFDNETVHRDIKPHNLMLTHDGVVKILDFGLASFRVKPQTLTSDVELSTEDTVLTLDTTKLGTEGYVAPEQAQDARSADIRSDIFSLGYTLFYLLTGRPPFVGIPTDPDSTPDITESRKDLPNELPAVLGKMMAWRPDDRYQQPVDASRALRAIDFEMRDDSVSTHSEPAADTAANFSEKSTVTGNHMSPMVSPGKPSNKWWYLIAAALVLIAVVVVTIIVLNPS